MGEREWGERESREDLQDRAHPSSPELGLGQGWAWVRVGMGLSWAI